MGICLRRLRSAVLVALASFPATFCLSLSADDNLLGLPDSLDPDRPGAVMLHGGGLVTEETLERFVELAGGREAKLVFVPSAGYRVSSYVDEEEFLDVVSTRYGAWKSLSEQGRIRDFQFLYTDDPADADDADFVQPLAEATGVWFSGGAQSRLNHCFVGEYPTQTKFQELVRRVVERGGIVGGSSAGMAAMPQVMTLWEDRRAITAPAVAVTAHGLGLLTKAVVEQHFDARGGRLERFFNLLRDGERLDELTGRPGAAEDMVGLAVEEHTAVVARQDRLNVLGKGKAHVFLKTQAGRSINWQELRAGETARLKRDAPRERREEIVLVHESQRVAPNTTAASE
jgi:cyanophycinase